MELTELARWALAQKGHKRPKATDTIKHQNSPAAREYAAKLSTAMYNLIDKAPSAERLDLLRAVPTHDVLLQLGYHSSWRERKLAVQRTRGTKSKKPVYGVGPYVLDPIQRLRPDLKLDARFTSARLPRTLDGFVEDLLRDEANLEEKVPRLWKWLEGKLEARGYLAKVDDSIDPRTQSYVVSIGNQKERFSFTRFERIVTKARKPVKTIGELVEPVVTA